MFEEGHKDQMARSKHVPFIIAYHSSAPMSIELSPLDPSDINSQRLWRQKVRPLADSESLAAKNNQLPVSSGATQAETIDCDATTIESEKAARWRDASDSPFHRTMASSRHQATTYAVEFLLSLVSKT
jgi:hypothetical protein